MGVAPVLWHDAAARWRHVCRSVCLLSKAWLFIVRLHSPNIL